MAKVSKNSYYISANDQKRMVEMINEFMVLSEDGKNPENPKAQALMWSLFVDYADKIIKGTIYAPRYRYHRFDTMEDLIQEGRMCIYESILKKQWKELIPVKDEKGVVQYEEDGVTVKLKKGTNIFNFFTTVVANNLLSSTLKWNKDKDHRADQEIETLYDNENMQYHHDFNAVFVVKEFFDEMRKYFAGKEKFIDLTNLLEHYFHNNTGKKFIKKDFIEYAKIKCHSPSLINSFFSYIKRISTMNDIIKD